MKKLEYIPKDVLKSMNKNLPEGLTMQSVSEMCGGRPFKIYMLVNEKLNNADLEELNLSVRSSNCLKRANFLTIGALVNGIDGQNDLLKLRNLGKNSAIEIMAKLFVYQYTSLPIGQEKWYMDKILEVNGLKNIA